jgi:hypothetical protein
VVVVAAPVVVVAAPVVVVAALVEVVALEEEDVMAEVPGLVDARITADHRPLVKKIGSCCDPMNCWFVYAGRKGGLAQDNFCIRRM